jgi:hypothetical protein
VTQERAPVAVDREPLWLPLLRRLTDVSSEWVVWKNVESAVTGVGDIDSAAPRADWPRLTDAFHAWADEHALGPVIVCPHAPNLLHLVALDGPAPFFEVDLVARKVFLGSTLFVPSDLAPLTELDARGFRRTRSGAEGLIKLVNNGARRDGRANEEGLAAKHIPELLARDPRGVRDAARLLFGPARAPVLDLVHAVLNGSWDRRAMLNVQAWFLLRAVAEPASVAARVQFRRNRVRCPVLTAVFAGRRVPGDRVAWLDEVAREHEVRATSGVA